MTFLSLVEEVKQLSLYKRINKQNKNWSANSKITLILIHIHRKIAAAFITSHNTPSPNNIRPVNPENNNPKRSAKAVKIQTTKILL